MAIVPPSQRRSRTAHTVSGLEITIPAKRHAAMIGFLPIWLVGWAMGEATVARMLLSAEAVGPHELAMCFWLAAWTLGGGIALLVLGWTLFGRQRVVLSPATLNIRHELLGVGHTREYGLHHVRNLRFAPEVRNPLHEHNGLRDWGVGGGNVAFDHGAATVRFGTALDEAEARQIIDELTARHRFAGASA